MVDPGVRQVLLGRVVLQFLEINIPARFELAATWTGRRKNETAFLWRAAIWRSILGAFEEGSLFNRDTMQTYLRLCSLASVYIGWVMEHRHSQSNLWTGWMYYGTLDGRMLDRILSIFFIFKICGLTFFERLFWKIYYSIVS